MINNNLIGSSYKELPTPALVLDIEVYEKNSEMMMKHIKSNNVTIRPHAKTNKTPMIALLQMRAGAVGICCATIGEAEAMVYSGVSDVLIASQIVTEDKINRLVKMSHYSKISVAVDDIDNLRNIAKYADSDNTIIGILIEVDVGMGRCGVRDKKDALIIAKEAVKLKGIKFNGLMGYEGHTIFELDKETRKKNAYDSYNKLDEIRKLIEDNGITIETISGAGTGTYEFAAESNIITEIQAGSYIFMDTTYEKLELPFEQSLTVLSTVISLKDSKTVVIDAGMKAVSKERECPKVKGMDELVIKALSEAHGTGEIETGIENIKIGTKIELIPSHCCTTVNMYDNIAVVRNGIIEAFWPISARGAE